MDHSYYIPENKDRSEQAQTELDIISKMEEDNVLLTLPDNIEEARKQGTTSSMIDGVFQDTEMCGFSRKIEPNSKDFVGSKQIEENVKSMDHEAYLMQCSYPPQHDEGFKMAADFLNEEFVSDRHLKKHYSVDQPDASDKEYVTSPLTMRNTRSIMTEPDNENFVSPPQQFDELIHIEESEATSVVFVSSPQCSVYKMAFLKRSSLNKHITKCVVCGQNVIWLSLHMLNHTGELPHRCWVCGKVFIATANSNTWSSNLISTNENGFYDCDICEKEMTSRNYFTLHMKRHALTQIHLTCVCRTTLGSSMDTNILVTSAQKGSLTCVKTCVNLKHNEEQGRADVNDNQNPCSFCGHRFQSKFELDIHLLTHFRGRVQDCSVCVHGFASEEILLKHLINHVESSMYDSCAYVAGVQKKKQSVILYEEKQGIAVNYSSKQGLIQGTAEHPSYEQPHECDVLEKAIDTKRNISEYMLNHTGEQSDKCSVCGKVFIQKDCLRAHMLTHTKQGPHKCHVCGKDFAEKCFLETHLLTHPEQPFQCGMCEERFATIINLKIHMLTHIRNCPHKCSVCGKGFTQNSHLKFHMLTHTAERPHKCDVCGKGFIEKFSLTRHMLTHTAERPHKCDVCGRGFIEKCNLTRHIWTHTAERPHKCNVCGKGFIEKSSLTRHILTHTVECHHRCSICGKGFTQKNAFTYHMLSHKGDTHKCRICRKGLKSKSNLKKHMLTHSEGHHKCGVCGKGFIQKRSLVCHMLTHTRERQNCGVCGKAFRSKINLTNHMLIHTEEYPYNCDVCGKGYKSKHNLTRHMLTHTKKVPDKCDV